MFSTCVLKAYLNSSDLGNSVSQVETLIRKHEAFEKVLDAQEEKVCYITCCITQYIYCDIYIKKCPLVQEVRKKLNNMYR